MARHRVLLVDHDAEARASVCDGLRTRFDVVEAFDGQEALDMIDDCDPDFAVIDPDLPRTDGFRLCQEIRRHSSLASIPIIFISTECCGDNLKRAYAAGANLCLSKPIDPAIIIKNLLFEIEYRGLESRHKRFSVDELKRKERRRLLEEMRRRKAERETPPVSAAPPPRAEAQARASVAHEVKVPDLSDDAPPLRVPVSPPPKESGKPEPLVRRPSPGPEVREAMPEPAPSFRTDGTGIPRIVIIDNNDDDREAIDDLMRKQFEVVSLQNGVEALEVIEQYEPDLLVMDVILPKMNGYQFLQYLRRCARFKSVPVVVVSAKASRRDRDYVRRLGVADYLAKPFDADDLLSCVEAITNMPDFRIAEKKSSIEEIIEREYLRVKDRSDPSSQRDRQHKYGVLQEILKVGPFDRRGMK